MISKDTPKITQTKDVGESGPDWTFRASTLDRLIFNGVVLHNEYRLPARFQPDDIVIDIGAHIGSFSYAAVWRGCQNVYAIEPDEANFEIAARHLREYIQQGHVKLVRGAVWRSDENDDELFFDGYHPFPRSFAGMEGILNTGNGSVIWGEGKPVAKIAFDQIADELSENGARRIRLLKLDCEGGEWPILLTSQRLHLIDEICGEFHELGGEFLEISEDRATIKPIFDFGNESSFTIERLVDHLEEAGFAVQYERHRRPTGAIEGLGLFFASRREMA